MRVALSRELGEDIALTIATQRLLAAFESVKYIAARLAAACRVGSCAIGPGLRIEDIGPRQLEPAEFERVGASGLGAAERQRIVAYRLRADAGGDVAETCRRRGFLRVTAIAQIRGGELHRIHRAGEVLTAVALVGIAAAGEQRGESPIPARETKKGTVRGFFVKKPRDCPP